LDGTPFLSYGTCQKFYENGRTYETTEDTEKHSASSKKQIKRERLGRCKIDSLVENEFIFREKGKNRLEGTAGRE
jgi:hypothetical protein